MGTWGVSPFESDSAQDFLDGLADISAGQREEAVRRMLSYPVNDAASLMRDVVPEEVMAAAALVALGLPGGAELPWRDDEASTAALSESSSAALAGMALRAVDVVVAPDGWWWRGWVSEDDRVQAGELVSQLRSALGESSA